MDEAMWCGVAGGTLLNVSADMSQFLGGRRVDSIDSV